MEQPQSLSQLKSGRVPQVPPLNGSMLRPLTVKVPEVLVTDYMPTILKMFAGGHQTFLLDAEGGVWGAGENSHGQLGITSVEPQDEHMNPTKVSARPEGTGTKSHKNRAEDAQVLQETDEFSDGMTVTSTQEHQLQIHEFTLVDGLLNKVFRS